MLVGTFEKTHLIMPAIKEWFLEFTRLRPQFLIIGAMRSGTTSLYRYLCKHPLVVEAARKEVHFFDHNYQEGFEWYARQFASRFSPLKGCGNRLRLITGEASPSYLLHPLAPARAAGHMPDAKLIAILRDPVARAFSHYHHGLRRQYESLPTFEEALDAEPARLAHQRDRLVSEETQRSDPFLWYSYCARGCYLDQLQEWLKFFPREKLLILISEDFYADPSTALRQVTDFLGLPKMPAQASQSFRKHNESHYDGMNPETRQRLVEFFRPHNQRLAEFLGRELPWRM